MKILFNALFATVIGSLLVFNPVFGGSEELPAFDTVDTNQDGMISRDEASQVPEIANLYNGADLDRDGALNPDEYDQAKEHLEKKS